MALQAVKIDRRAVDDALERFARIGDTGDGGVERLSFSREDRAARDKLQKWWESIGLTVSRDEAGNMFGLRPGAESLPPIMIGSHLDTVPAGGRFDGALGVIVATEVVRALLEAGTTLRHPLMVVNFTAEEPSPFGKSTIGSRAFAGRLQPDELTLRDGAGRTLAAAIDEIGGRAEAITAARRRSGDIAAFLELHIEQGRVLYDAGAHVGIVTDIAGIRRLDVGLRGEANHAGTTRMVHRKDALAAASEVVLAVESLVREFGDPAVGTVGKLKVHPNAANIVPGNAQLTVEFRHIDATVLDELQAQITGRIEEVAARRGVSAACGVATNIAPVAMDPFILDVLERVCTTVSGSHMRLPSMASHDAAHVAAVAPAGMIFVASREGRSHTPDEWSDPDAIATGAQVMLEAVLQLDALLSTGRRDA